MSRAILPRVFTPVEIIIALVVSMIGAALQGVVGFGFGVFSVPILTIVNPELTPIPQLILALPLTTSIALMPPSARSIDLTSWLPDGCCPECWLV